MKFLYFCRNCRHEFCSDDQWYWKGKETTSHSYWKYSVVRYLSVNIGVPTEGWLNVSNYIVAIVIGKGFTIPAYSFLLSKYSFVAFFSDTIPQVVPFDCRLQIFSHLLEEDHGRRHARDPGSQLILWYWWSDHYLTFPSTFVGLGVGLTMRRDHIYEDSYAAFAGKVLISFLRNFNKTAAFQIRVFFFLYM